MAKESKKKQFLKHLSDSKGIVSYACEKTGISRTAAYKWKQKSPAFAQEWDDINERTIDVVESKLLNKINEEDITAIIFYLKTKGKKRGYVEQVDQNVTVNPFLELMKEVTSEDN